MQKRSSEFHDEKAFYLAKIKELKEEHAGQTTDSRREVEFLQQRVQEYEKREASDAQKLEDTQLEFSKAVKTLENEVTKQKHEAGRYRQKALEYKEDLYNTKAALKAREAEFAEKQLKLSGGISELLQGHEVEFARKLQDAEREKQRALVEKEKMQMELDEKRRVALDAEERSAILKEEVARVEREFEACLKDRELAERRLDVAEEKLGTT